MNVLEEEVESCTCEEKNLSHKGKGCSDYILPLQDALEILGGKWKIIIILALTFGPRRFKVLQREIGISGKMLSKELKELEMNQIVSRKVFDTTPVTVEYTLTEYGRTLEKVIKDIREWGVNHRRKIFS